VWESEEQPRSPNITAGELVADQRRRLGDAHRGTGPTAERLGLPIRARFVHFRPCSPTTPVPRAVGAETR